MARRIQPRLLALALAMGVAAALAQQAGLTASLELAAYDRLWQQGPAGRAAVPVTLLRLDDTSRQRLGRWPWPAGAQAQLLDQLRQAAVVIWPADGDLAPVVRQAISRHGRVMLASHPGQTAPVHVTGLLGAGPLGFRQDRDLWVRAMAGPLPDVAWLATHVATPRVPPAARWVQFVPADQLPEQSLAQVATLPPTAWQGRIVVVDVEDSPWATVMTPVGRLSPMAVVAQAAASTLAGQDRQPQPPGAVTAGAMALALLAGWAWQVLSPWRAVPALAALSGAIMVSDAALYAYGRTWLPWPTWLLALWGGYGVLALQRQIAGNRMLAVVVDQLLNSYKERKVRHAFTTGPLHRHRALPGANLPFEDRIAVVGEIARTFHAERGFFQMLLESNHQPVLVVDGDAGIFVCNAAGQQLLGREVIGKNLFDLLAPMVPQAQLDDMRLGFQRAWLSNNPYQRFLPIGEHTYRANLVPTRDVEGMLCLFDDVTALHERANTDALTGLWNRRFFDEQIEVEMSRARRYRDYHVALVFVDIDHFKRFNDECGHLVGDRVLKTVANVVKGVVRTSDFAVRYGGEELAILLTHTDQEGARLFAERLRQRVADAPLFDEHGNPLERRVTVSVGVAGFAGDANASALLGRADEALYRSKSAGRNQVSVA
jgi:diguanylate cyclase (GGDEF)-like protein